MSFTSYHLFLAGLMLITGTLTTISAKWANMQKAHFCNESENATEFHHPFVQALNMFVGEFVCLLAFKFIWYSTAHYRINRMTFKGNPSSPIIRCWPIRINKEINIIDGEQNFIPLILLIPALLDMTSSCLGYFSLNYISAGTYQMLRGSVMVFTALFSILFLKKRLTIIQWIGIFTVIAGLVIAGLVSTLFGNNNGSNKSTTGQQILGVVFVIFAMIFTALQVVYQERFISRYCIPPLQLVGWEGIFGFICLGVLLIPFNYITWEHSHASPDHRLEHLPSVFCQMADNHIIIYAIVGNTFSVGLLRYAGAAVTKELSSTTRMVLDSGRTVLVYIISVTIFHTDFHLLDILGLVLLIIGICTYNGIWSHLCQRYRQRKRILNEKTTLVSDSNEMNPYTSGDTKS